jgi:four helix bundle protein
MSDFKKLLVWRNGMDIIVEALTALQDFPDDEQFGLKFQVLRTAVSITSSIAEGNELISAGEYKRHLEIALNAAHELEIHILIAQNLKGADEMLMQSLLKMINEEQHMIVSFIDRLRT